MRDRPRGSELPQLLGGEEFALIPAGLPPVSYVGSNDKHRRLRALGILEQFADLTGIRRFALNENHRLPWKDHGSIFLENRLGQSRKPGAQEACGNHHPGDNDGRIGVPAADKPRGHEIYSGWKGCKEDPDQRVAAERLASLF